MSIKVCDAVMGSGKSSAAIDFVRSHPEKRFLYITPYLSEADRFVNACAGAVDFVKPNTISPEFSHCKYNHLLSLVKNGESIASTHQMFCNFRNDVVEAIRQNHYTLIIDEAVNVFVETILLKPDIDVLKQLGWVDESLRGKALQGDIPEYKGKMFRSLYQFAGVRQLNKLTEVDSNNYYYWTMDKSYFDAFDDVYILTYMFDCQTLKYYFDMNDVQYEYIGVEHPSPDVYRFTTRDKAYIPEYIGMLSQSIHIFNNKKANTIGAKRGALSVAWFQKHNSESPDIVRLKKDIYNYFNNYMKGFPASQRMWSTYKSEERKVKGAGYTNAFLAFNSRATNDYMDRCVLAYCVNVHMHPYTKRFFVNNGIDVREDRMALSTMLQWIWRSRIRQGEEIWIYVPSKRMRELLINWIQEVQNEYEEYIQRRKTDNE